MIVSMHQEPCTGARYAARVQLNRSLETQCSSSTSSRRRMAICATGPPHARNPKRRKHRKSWPY